MKDINIKITLCIFLCFTSLLTCTLTKVNLSREISRKYISTFNQKEDSYNSIRRNIYLKKILPGLKKYDTVIFILNSNLSKSSNFYDAIIVNNYVKYYQGYAGRDSLVYYQDDKFTYPDSLINIIKKWDIGKYDSIEDVRDNEDIISFSLTYFEMIMQDNFRILKPKALPFDWNLGRRVKGGIKRI